MSKAVETTFQNTLQEAGLSRTEELLVAIAEALAARQRVEEIKKKHERFQPEAYGEASLEVEIAQPSQAYVQKLDRLRGVMRHLGMTT